jgi:hypothetical protein
MLILPLDLQPALFAGAAVVNRAGPGMLPMLQNHAIGDYRILRLNADEARCAIRASPSATPARPRGYFTSGATSPPGRPASIQAGLPRRRGSTWLCRTRTSSHPA